MRYTRSVPFTAMFSAANASSCCQMLPTSLFEPRMHRSQSHPFISYQAQQEMPSGLLQLDITSKSRHRLLPQAQPTLSFELRTKKFKAAAIISSVLFASAFAVILVQWRGPINVWETLCIFPVGFVNGMLNSGQFVGVSATVEKSRLATAISLFFLSGQIGMMAGTSASSAILRPLFRNNLCSRLGDSEYAQKVSVYMTPDGIPPVALRAH